MCVLTWNFPRASFWLLDRDGIRGHYGESQLKPAIDDDEDEEEQTEEQPAKGIGSVETPDRWIYCMDLRDFNNHEPYVQEVRRIAAECRERRANVPGKTVAKPVMVTLGSVLGQAPAAEPPAQINGKARFTPEQLLTPPNRRWYPVIDYSRCTNCLECLDFCLFGVYGVDKIDRITVENQDSCKKGCPACSRVCPEQAIMFPDYKTPAIAGAPVGAIGGLKIDLTKLFGGDVKDALGQAVLERDRELVADGRDAVGMAVGIPKRQADKPAAPKDELDSLMDQLDALDI
jgi:Pyruvate/2-oxoacid:ferredoxin oxidoreductase delta subunit